MPGCISFALGSRGFATSLRSGLPQRGDGLPGPGPVLIDGHLNEGGMGPMPGIGTFVDLVSGRPVRWNTRVRLLWDDEISTSPMRSRNPGSGDLTHHNDPLYSENDVEFFLAGDDAYYELEVNARNTPRRFYLGERLCVGGFSASPEFPRSQLQGFDGVGFHGHPRGGRLGHFNWRFRNSLRGADPGHVEYDRDQDRGWTVGFRCRGAGMEWLAKARQPNPAACDGDEWRMDFRGSTR